MSAWRPFGSDGPTLGELAQQAWSSTDHGYDLLAPRFDRTPFRTPDVIVQRTLDLLGRDDATLAHGLDVCCGTGAALAQLRTRCTRVVGIDRSAGMLREARQRVPDATLVQGDALAMPFRACFDVAVSFGAFGHILEEDEPRFVRAVHDALKPGGRFVFVTAHPPPLLSRRHIVARAFNGVMRVRNAVKRPQFIMYYLTFLLPRARALLEDAGFDVRVHELDADAAAQVSNELGSLKGYVIVDARRR
jgi:SAM-dependent methyltransferase